MSNTDWSKKFEDMGALWRMNYDNLDGAHAQLTSGKHSDGFCNCSKIVENPQYVTEVAAGMIEKIQSELGEEKIDWVIGPAYGAITFAYEIARQLGTHYGFTEVEYAQEGKMQVLKRFDIPKEANVLVVEDVKTTGGSAQKTIDVLEQANINVLPVVGLIVNWSGESKVGNKKAVALVDGKMNVWEPEACELCKKGSKAVRPKANWNALSR